MNSVVNDRAVIADAAAVAGIMYERLLPTLPLRNAAYGPRIALRRNAKKWCLPLEILFS